MNQRIKRKRRIRKKIFGTKDCPRLCVYRSLKNIEAQLIDDSIGRTIIAARSKEKTGKNKIEIAERVGQEIAKEAKNKKITRVRFDRGGFAYHGRVKSLAEGARKGGLKF